MGILKLQNALKSIIVDYGVNILNDSGKTKNYLNDYTGDESKDVKKIFLSLIGDDVHSEILKIKEFDDQMQISFIADNTPSKDTGLAKAVLEMLFTVFYDFNRLFNRMASF